MNTVILSDGKTRRYKAGINTLFVTKRVFIVFVLLTGLTTFSFAQPIAIAITQTDVLCSGQCNGTASANPSGGTAPYTYLWAPTGQTTQTATGLCAGSYTVTITDAMGTTSVNFVMIFEPPVLTVTVTPTNVLCNGGCTGTATVTVGGGSPAYTYSWTPTGGTNSIATGLCPGNYTVNVTDANGCTGTGSVSITEPPPLTTTISSTNPNCNGGGGSATITAAGGTPGYTYSWNPSGGNSSTATGLSAGNYTATVTDANGCTSTKTVTIAEPPLLTVSVTTNSASCLAADGDATATPSGGTPTYTYSWSNGQTTQTATGLAASNYTLTVTDANGCTKTELVTILNTGAPQATISPIVNISCNGANDGSLTVNVTGGTPSFTYSWNPSGQTTSAATGLSAGNYMVTVTDALGCFVVTSATITEPSALTASVSSTNGNCGAAGTATVTANGGTPGYIYVWSPSGGTTSTATGLSAGNYTAAVTDANGCTRTQTITITSSNTFSLSVSSTPAGCTVNNGTATANTNGGTSPFTYSWTPSVQTTQTATGLGAGTYTATVRDANGCTQTQTVSITANTNAPNTIMSQTNILCNAQCTGTAQANVTGGTPPYTYLWTGGQTTSSASNLCAGNYTIMVTDTGGCTTTQTITITEPTALTVSVTTTTASCLAADGDATANPAGGTGGYTYSWSNTQTSQTASGLFAGTYTVTVADANGCTKTEPANVSNTGSPQATISPVVNISCNGASDGSLTVNVTVGTPPYSYSWNPSNQTTSAATGLSAGIYVVTVTDALGCIVIASDTITEPNILTTSVSSTNGNCGATGSATVTVNGGTPGYTYSWNPGGETSSTVTGLSAGNYTAAITDVNGCTQTQTITITSNSALSINVTSTQTGCATSNGTATVNPNSGTAPYTYNWSNGQTTQMSTGLAAGTYTITVTDVNACSQTQTVSVTQTSGPIASAIASSYTITMGASTSLTANGGGVYSWSPASGLSCITCANSIATPNSTTIYCVTAADTNGCSDSACVTVLVQLNCSDAGELFIPNAFSPNDDGENDFIQVYYGNMECIKTFKFVIYNRWGEKIFSTTDPTAQWDGSYRGKEAGTAVFVFYMNVTFTSGEELNKKGNISLIR